MNGCPNQVTGTNAMAPLAEDFLAGSGPWTEPGFKRGALDSFYLFAGSHPELARFGMGVALNRAELASGSFCWANSFLNAATLCSASASVAAVPRTCAMSSFKAVLSISIPRLARPRRWLQRLRNQKK